MSEVTIRKEAWSFYRTSSGVRLCWELEEPKGPKGSGTEHVTAVERGRNNLNGLKAVTRNMAQDTAKMWH